MEIHLLFAKLAWILLIVVMLLRPLNDIFRLKIFRTGMRYRKYLGIAMGLSALVHIFLFVIGNGLAFSFFLGPVWSFDTMLGWGMLAIIFTLPPLITSNVFSQKLLKKNWKRVQMLCYFVYIFTAIHVALVNGRILLGLIPLGLWIVFWIWAWIMKKK